MRKHLMHESELAQLERKTTCNRRMAAEQTAVVKNQFVKERGSDCHELLELKAAHEKLVKAHTSLQKQLNDANAAFQYAQEKNEKLLAQLHQVQEELEGHYVAGQRMLSVINQSEATLHRARKVIINLINS